MSGNNSVTKGGAISSIILFRGTGENMLTEPISCAVTTADWKTTLSDVNAPPWSAKSRATANTPRSS